VITINYINDEYDKDSTEWIHECNKSLRSRHESGIKKPKMAAKTRAQKNYEGGE
jgi:hypothetical protein